MKSFALIFLLAFSFSSQAKSIKCRSDKRFPRGGIVKKVVDGDTINLEADHDDYYPIRILGIDTPESHYRGKSQGYWANQATYSMGRLAPLGTRVRLQYDKEHCDGFGRYLAYVYSPKGDVGAHQIKKGLAINYCIYPNMKKCRFYSHLANQAYEEGNSIIFKTEIPYLWRIKVRGGSYNKPVADIRGFKVYPPEETESIWPFYRLFFLRWSDVDAPYHRAP